MPKLLADPPSLALPSALPARRLDLVVQPLGIAGDCVITDPLTCEHLTIGEHEQFLLAALDGRQTAEGLRAAFEQRWGEPLAEEDLDEFVRLAAARMLLRSPVPGTVRGDERTAAARHDASPPAPLPAGGTPSVRNDGAGAERPGRGAPPEVTDPPIAGVIALPARRRDLVVRPTGEDGQYVVKDPLTGDYFGLGEQEHFLLVGLDGQQTADELRAAFERRWGESLAPKDVDEFVAMAAAQGFLCTPGPGADGRGGGQTAAGRSRRQSLLFWRKSAFDPDRLFTWLAPRLRFVWTPAFMVASAAGVLLAMVLLWANRREFVTHFADVGAVRWETWLLAWLTLVAATTLHEFAHGLTCKHFGGEVHEVGFLMMFFVPCLYCNVSDAWLFRGKAKRLWVTLAGGYCDLLVFAAAVVVWRVTPQASFPNYLAWVVVSVAGARNLFNFNPLLKLDGYYLLSDALGLPNLRQRAWDRFTATARWLMWGAARPAANEPRGRFLTLFGLASWSFSLVFLCLMLWGYLRFFGARWGAPGLAVVALLAAAVLPSMAHGFSSGEFRIMLTKRRMRVVGWVVGLGAVAVAAFAIPMEDRASGQFELRAAARVELRAPTAGFLRAVHAREGCDVPAGATVATLEVPDLDSRAAQKRAEVAEAEARRALAWAGPRSVVPDSVPNLDAARAEQAAAEAQVSRLREELAYLGGLRAKQSVRSPVAGVMVTAHADERVGQFLKEGDPICTVESCGDLRVEVRLPEEAVGRVRPGQVVELKVRALPFETLRGTVEAVAPIATAPTAGQGGAAAGTVTVYCRLAAGMPASVRPAMTGEARIACGRRPAAIVLTQKLLRYVRTEFWW